MNCPSCEKHGIIRNDYDITEYDTHTNYAFYCGHFCNIKKVNTYTDKHGNIHKYVGDIFDYHNAHLMALMINEQQEDER